jgi:histidinol-phosphate aminotransferase
MSRFWSRLTHDLKPYVPGEQPRMAELVKLNTNESPFGPSPRALEALRGEANETLRLYPDPQATALRAALATYHAVRPEQVFVGNGSDEVLAHAFAALLKHDAPLLFPDITYSFYPVYCRLFGIACETVPLDQAMQINIADYRRPAGAIILPNPNAPTGVALSRAEIVTLLHEHPDAPVVIDEAYVDFGAETAIPLVASHPNLLVVQTMSKSRALAGLRVGYAIGDADLIEGLTRVKDSFNSYPLGRPAQAGAIASLEDEAHFQQSKARVIAGRERLTYGLLRLGFEALPSSANFVFAGGCSSRRRVAPAGGDRPPFFNTTHRRLFADHGRHRRTNRPAVGGPVGYPGRCACRGLTATPRSSPRPACGAEVENSLSEFRVRGLIRESDLVERPPHPGPLPARGAREKCLGSECLRSGCRPCAWRPALHPVPDSYSRRRRVRAAGRAGRNPAGYLRSRPHRRSASP